MDRTFVIVKPDGVERRLIGEIVARLERKQLSVVAAELRRIDRATAEQHYGEHAGKPFFPGETYKVVRNLMGATNPKDSAPGTIRGDLAIEMTENLIHGSDSPESAAREIALFFPNLA
ncbi:MAG: nucleoside-diphosphate kinase [Actinobacteria bacterium]|nr:nucleoside-diphosphate kinase [Actinomycetota bacterium]